MEALVIHAAEQGAGFVRRHPWLVAGLLLLWLLWEWLMALSIINFVVRPVQELALWLWRSVTDLEAKAPLLGKLAAFGLLLLVPLPVLLLLFLTNLG